MIKSIFRRLRNFLWSYNNRCKTIIGVWGNKDEHAIWLKDRCANYNKCKVCNSRLCIHAKYNKQKPLCSENTEDIEDANDGFFYGYDDDFF